MTTSSCEHTQLWAVEMLKHRCCKSMGSGCRVQQPAQLPRELSPALLPANGQQGAARCLSQFCWHMMDCILQLHGPGPDSIRTLLWDCLQFSEGPVKPCLHVLVGAWSSCRSSSGAERWSRCLGWMGSPGRRLRSCERRSGALPACVGALTSIAACKVLACKICLKTLEWLHSQTVCLP